MSQPNGTCRAEKRSAFRHIVGPKKAEYASLFRPTAAFAAFGQQRLALWLLQDTAQEESRTMSRTVARLLAESLEA